jgi:creatinine amidohydrolase
MDYMFDVCHSILDMGFNKLSVLDCHGHHSGPLDVVSRQLYDTCEKAIATISPARLSQQAYNAVRKSEQGGSIHGGEWETALLLHLCPEVVDMEKATDEDTMRYHSEFIAGDNFMGSQQVSWSTWDIQPSKTGLYGTPTVATAETGRVIMDAAVENGARFLKEYWSAK